MLIDTHCHLDTAEFDPDRMQMAQAAWRAGVYAIVIPAVERTNFFTVGGAGQSDSGRRLRLACPATISGAAEGLGVARCNERYGRPYPIYTLSLTA